MRKTSVYIETLGCQMNVSDSERAASTLCKNGFKLAPSTDSADVVIINTCSVREKAERKALRRVEEIARSRGAEAPLIGLMGCVAQLEGEALFDYAPSVGFVAGTGATERIPQLIRKAVAGKTFDLGERRSPFEGDLEPAFRHSARVAFVPIIEGCNKFCTYCIVPYSRGRERSRAATEILREVRSLLAQGFKEIHLIGQNVNSYRPKYDGGPEKFPGATPFSRLLRAVASTGMPRIKFTTSFPRDFHADIVKAIDENENLCNWVHLPVQSGSDRVLRAMRRGYKVVDFIRHVEAIKGARRRISLTSDIIVGFPGETREEFEDTRRLVERCGFEGLYIFKYSARRGTPAAKLADTVEESEKTDRFQSLEKLQASAQQKIYTDFLGAEVLVLAEGLSARSADDLTGHTTCNKVVNFRGGRDMVGKIVRVRVDELKSHSLYGEALGVL
ncbi:MAG TPA: tRNA (N6-isopentenyl adenosine(37)-C2)-methylthiotransferase MiaB [Pyrinomonadaceae bacterium]|nr:tRNA (N6-isopentenyl adenosine(37)-C2)-methylthiotransferase MiaB [Pyrinomonadaceae bacterium]